MEQNNLIKDFFSEELIYKDAAICFYSSINEAGLFITSYTNKAYEFYLLPKIAVYNDFEFAYLVEDTNIHNLFQRGYHSYGRYNTKIIYHCAVLEKLDCPVTYKKFDNMQTLITHPIKDPVKAKRMLAHNQSMGMVSPTNRILEGNDYTFGVEIETSQGRVDHYDDFNLNCVYDGSLKDEKGNCYGGEYVTGILRGDTGLFHLKKITSRLVESNCGVNHKCSIHVHVGNINWSSEQVVLAWALGCQLEEELFSMMPHSRRKNEFCQTLNAKLPIVMDYEGLKKLTKLDEEISTQKAFNSIYKVVVSNSYSMPNNNCNKMSNHPEGAKQRYNHQAQRYCWLNFVPLMFNIRNNTNSRTIEFRSHSSTLNYKKIENWLKICVAFVAIIDNYSGSYKRGEILTLEDVVRKAYPKGGESLIEYINERKKKFSSKKLAELQELDEYNETIKIGNESIKNVVCV